jgi:hypothetical protein
MQKGNGSQLGEALGEDLLAAADERQIALDVRLIRAEAEDLRRHPLLVSRVVEMRPVREEDAVERIDGNEREVVLRLAAAQSEQLGDQPGRGDDRRATVESESVPAIDIGATTRLIALLEHGDVMPTGREADRRRQPAEPAADDDHALRCHLPSFRERPTPQVPHTPLRLPSWRPTVEVRPIVATAWIDASSSAA